MLFRSLLCPRTTPTSLYPPHLPTCQALIGRAPTDTVSDWLQGDVCVFGVQVPLLLQGGHGCPSREPLPQGPLQVPVQPADQTHHRLPTGTHRHTHTDTDTHTHTHRYHADLLALCNVCVCMCVTGVPHEQVPEDRAEDQSDGEPQCCRVSGVPRAGPHQGYVQGTLLLQS